MQAQKSGHNRTQNRATIIASRVGDAKAPPARQHSTTRMTSSAHSKDQRFEQSGRWFFSLPRHAAFKLLSRVRREPRPKPQALSLPSKRCITASWRQQGRESSGKMVKAGKRRAKRYSLRPPPARGEEGASFFRMRGKKNQALRYVLEPKRHKNGAKWQEAPTENGGRVAECRPAPGRPGGTTAATAEPKAEAASPRGRQTRNGHRFPAVARDSDRPGRAGDGRTPKKNWA